MIRIKAYQDGYQACREGEAVNPYILESPLGQAWTRGYDDAAADRSERGVAADAVSLGRIQYEEGKCIFGSNPYPSRTNLAFQWENGWMEAWAERRGLLKAKKLEPE